MEEKREVNEKEKAQPQAAETPETAETPEETKDPAHFHIDLKTPVEYNGRVYGGLDFDFGKLTGQDAANIEAELDALGKTAISAAFSSDYLIRMAAKASGEPIGADFFNAVTLKTYEQVKNAARRFLLAAD